MKEKKITVVCGIYFPPEALFKKFLDSCVAQTMSDVEFLFFIDHPDDKKSRKILKSYEKKFKNNKNSFTIIENEKNIGDIETYKKSLLFANGEYICFLDNDDFFDKDFLEIMYKYIKKTNSDAVLCNAIIHYCEKDILYELLDDFMWDTWSFLYKKDTFIKILEESPNKYFFDPAIKLYQSAYRIPLYEGAFYHYVRHETNMSMYQINDEKSKNKNHNQYMDDYDYDPYNTRKKLKKRFRILFKEGYNDPKIIFDELSKYSTLDKNLNNSNINYKTIKGL